MQNAFFTNNYDFLYIEPEAIKKCFYVVLFVVDQSASNFFDNFLVVFVS